MTDKEQKYYDTIRDLLIGRKITDVYYEELDYQNNTDYWELTADTHSIDMNVIFHLDNQDLIQIKWDNEFYCYGIGLERLEKLDYRENVKTIKVTGNQNWTELIDKEITDINVLWEIEDTKEHHYKNNKLTETKDVTIILPQTWELTFNNDKTIWISALELRDNEEPSYWADHLTVFFTDQGQEKYKLKKASAQQRLRKHAG